ncbi:MAG TPA: hypothetical protein VGJ33_07930 [Candidatus Angelobacter sp.]|jgi:hypothetical protein
METASLLFHLLPAFVLTGYGTYAVLEVFFPSLRDADFNRWEVDDNSGSYVEIMGWRKMLKPPRVIAQGYLSERSACLFSFTVGTLMIAIGLLLIRHLAGIPQSFPDWFNGQR